LPHTLKAENAKDKAKLMEELSIENWILPACYIGLIDRVAWVHPAWSKQLPDGKHELRVGKHGASGGLRVAGHFASEAYFASEGDACLDEELDPADCKDVELLVVADTDSMLAKRLQDFFRRPGAGADETPLVLDVDMDYFSVKDPFQAMFPAVPDLHALLKPLYSYEPIPAAAEPEARTNYAIDAGRRRREKVDLLESIFEHLAERDGSLEGYSGPGQPLLDAVRGVVDAVAAAQPEVDWLTVHDAGCTLDDTSLPEHVSDWTEIEASVRLVASTASSLLDVAEIKLATAARSAEDGYTPSEQVDRIENALIRELFKVFPEMEVGIHYRGINQ